MLHPQFAAAGRAGATIFSSPPPRAGCTLWAEWRCEPVSNKSNLEQYREDRVHQGSTRRDSIIDAAQELFLEGGIANTTMIDITDRAGVSRVTVYRHFAERDDIAVEVAERMLGQLAAIGRSAWTNDMPAAEASREALIALARGFEQHRDVHYYLSMFDSLRPLRPEIETRYRERASWAFAGDDDTRMNTEIDDTTLARITTMTHTVLAVLGRFAITGDELGYTQGVPISTQIDLLVEAIHSYYETIVIPNLANPAAARKRARQPRARNTG